MLSKPEKTVLALGWTVRMCLFSSPAQWLGRLKAMVCEPAQVLAGAAARLGSGIDHQQRAWQVVFAGDFEAGRVARFGDAKPDFLVKMSQENANKAQHQGQTGVPESMATMVMDNSTLEATAAWPMGTGKPEPGEDAALMLRAAAGDDSCFSLLAEKYHRPMIHFLFRMVHNQAVAEELAQEVFLRVYRARQSYRAEARFSTWLYRIATNLAVNYARDTRHERAAQTIYLDAPDEETGSTPDLANGEMSVEQRLLQDERMAAIREHVMALPERQRMAVLMHKYQGLDYKQIGEVLKLSESATKSLLFRAYQTLRETLKEFV
ncbi:RNA polymerase sigma factor [Telmatobacter bradus]|uniref:RNA polymerase sigma factor n=1 Tax=Telmatobacter bradus TaxID=474953 RepID=UPI003B435660